MEGGWKSMLGDKRGMEEYVREIKGGWKNRLER